MKEGDKRRPGSLQQPSVTPAHPGTKSDLSPERNVRVWPREPAPKTRPSSRSFHASHSCRGEVTCPASRVRSDGSGLFQNGEIKLPVVSISASVQQTGGKMAP